MPQNNKVKNHSELRKSSRSEVCAGRRWSPVVQDVSAAAEVPASSMTPAGTTASGNSNFVFPWQQSSFTRTRYQDRPADAAAQAAPAAPVVGTPYAWQSQVVPDAAGWSQDDASDSDEDTADFIPEDEPELVSLPEQSTVRVQAISPYGTHSPWSASDLLTPQNPVRQSSSPHQSVSACSLSAASAGGVDTVPVAEISAAAATSGNDVPVSAHQASVPSYLEAMGVRAPTLTAAGVVPAADALSAAPVPVGGAAAGPIAAEVMPPAALSSKAEPNDVGLPSAAEVPLSAWEPSVAEKSGMPEEPGELELERALNEEQIQAVTETEGYICLHAGAGTGKTRTLIYRYAYLIREYGISPRSVWCVTFTNKAANEMKNRVLSLCGSALGNPFVTTFHGFCALFLREEIMAIGWPRTFTICDVNDVKELLRPIYHECQIDGKKLPLKKAWEYIDSTKENKDYIEALIGADSNELLRRSDEAAEANNKLFWRYLYKQRCTYSLDFDDLILLTLHILNHFPEIRERWRQRFEYILVDEFQDIDRDQYELVEIIAGKHGNLFVVGDPDQTIYSFRGARVEYFNDFVNQHGAEAKRLFLTRNYRSQEHILAAAYSLICHNHDAERRPLQAQRQDITLDQMIVVSNPALKRRELLSARQAELMAARSYYGNIPDLSGAGTCSWSALTSDQGLGFKPDAALTRQLPFPHGNSTEQATYAAVSARAGQTTFKQERRLNRLGLMHVAPVPVPAQEPGVAVVLSPEQAVAAGGVGAQSVVMQAAWAQAAGADGAAFGDKAHTLLPVVVHTGSVYDEADFVADSILKIKELSPQATIAVLYRAHFLALNIENALVAHRIPYNVVGEVRFFDRQEIRDIMAYLRLRVNPDDDVALRRVINVPPRGFGKKRKEHLESLARSQGTSLFTTLLNNQDDTFLFGRNQLQNFVDCISNLAAQELTDPSSDFERVLNDSGYEEWIKQSGEDERLENIAALKNYLRDFRKTQDDEVNLADFINSVSLMTSADESVPDHMVRLMTVHNAKGLEFDYVFVISLNEAIFPSRKSVNELDIAEERRLMYVAMTRAKKQLILSEANGEIIIRNAAGAVAEPRRPSRFLSEMEDNLYAVVGRQPEPLSIPMADGTIAADKGSAKAQSEERTGKRVFHKIFGQGTIKEVRQVTGEYVVFFDKLGKERTLSFSAKIEFIDDK